MILFHYFNQIGNMVTGNVFDIHMHIIKCHAKDSYFNSDIFLMSSTYNVSTKL